MKYLLLGVIIALLAVVMIVFFRRKNKECKTAEGRNNVLFTTSIVDGTFCMADVVSYFKNLSLDEERHTPFIMNGLLDTPVYPPFDMLLDMLKIEKKEGYYTFVLGVYEEGTDELAFMKVIYCKQVDEQIEEVMKNESFVVLS